jgi:ATP-dependent helicase/DNAse subunit B
MELEKRAMFGDINQGIKGTLSRWLDGEIDSQKDGFFPALFETSFGDKYKRINQIPPIHITNQILLQGKIDRIDISLDNASFKIIDYKTGSSTISQKDVESGNKLQMPLYIKAAQYILEYQYNSIDPKAANPTYYSLQEFKSKNAFNRNSDIEEKIQSILEKTDQEILKMKEGHFPVKPLNKASCTYCNYSSICRIHTKTPSLSEQFSEEIDSHL